MLTVGGTVDVPSLKSFSPDEEQLAANSANDKTSTAIMRLDERQFSSITRPPWRYRASFFGSSLSEDSCHFPADS